jgi:hypothetical protein
MGYPFDVSTCEFFGHKCVGPRIFVDIQPLFHRSGMPKKSRKIVEKVTTTYWNFPVRGRFGYSLLLEPVHKPRTPVSSPRRLGGGGRFRLRRAPPTCGHRRPSPTPFPAAAAHLPPPLYSLFLPLLPIPPTPPCPVVSPPRHARRRRR